MLDFPQPLGPVSATHSPRLHRKRDVRAAQRPASVAHGGVAHFHEPLFGVLKRRKLQRADAFRIVQQAFAFFDVALDFRLRDAASASSAPRRARRCTRGQPRPPRLGAR